MSPAGDPQAARDAGAAVAAEPGAGDVSAELTSGALLADRYELVRPIGRGGMGVVYLARDQALEREVAIKIIGDPRHPQREQRFLREARLASRVHHPHTVYVVDFGTLPGGGCFLVMELLQGKTLAATLAECRTLPSLRVCRIGAMIASALQSIHAQGIVHRDLKPATLMPV